jgi:hypothetical protein
MMQGLPRAFIKLCLSGSLQCMLEMGMSIVAVALHSTRRG